MFEDVCIRDVKSARLLRPILASICFATNDATPAHRQFDALASELFFDVEVQKAFARIADKLATFFAFI